ncbi:hypothetical protein HDU96_008280 [Phlyctochytrium bullatum]|nr:hypothetical protein HDU96_008280 [Phlyctochytrium bullatum]
MSKLAALVLLLAYALTAHAGAPAFCPPLFFGTKDDFRIGAYTGVWYLREAIPTGYMQASALNCNMQRVFQNSSDLIKIESYGLVNGAFDMTSPVLYGTFSPVLRGRYHVYPEGYNFFSGRPMYVVDASDVKNGQYEWVALTAGYPINKDGDGYCVAKTVNPLAPYWSGSNIGLFIWARNAGLQTDFIKERLKKKGLSSQSLVEVKHDSCNDYKTAGVAINVAI